MAYFTLEYGINVQVVINVHVRYFCQNNKRTGLNKRTGGNLENKNLTLNRATLLIPVAKHELFGYKYNKGLTTAILWKTILRFLQFDSNLRFLFPIYSKSKKLINVQTRMRACRWENQTKNNKCTCTFIRYSRVHNLKIMP